MARSIALKWPTSSPADQRPSAGLVFHCLAGTASAARKSSPFARARFSMMIARAGRIHRGKRDASDSGPSRLLESVGQLQDARLSERRSKNLQAHGQFPIDLAAWHGDAWYSRQGSCNCIYISKIHL